MRVLTNQMSLWRLKKNKSFPSVTFFFYIIIYTKSNKRKIQQCPDDIYLVLSGGIKMIKYITNANK